MYYYNSTSVHRNTLEAEVTHSTHQRPGHHPPRQSSARRIVGRGVARPRAGPASDGTQHSMGSHRGDGSDSLRDMRGHDSGGTFYGTPGVPAVA